MARRLVYRQSQYACAKGRNGSFVPRVLAYEFSRHDDGTLLVTLRIYSRRASQSAPIELTLSASDWESHALALQLDLNEERRRLRTSRDRRP